MSVVGSAIKITAKRLVDGTEITLKNLKNMRILSSLDSPAQSFCATFAAEALPAELGTVKVYEGAKLLFTGKTDCQKVSVSKDGVILQLDARSSGALLLDNQALPCCLINARITTVFNRFIAPYGFSLYSPGKPDYLPMYTVRAGTSEWDALVNFTRRVYGVTPYVKGGQIMVKRHGTGAPLVISNSGDGLAYSCLTHTRTPYNILSKIVLRDEDGNYSSAVNNSSAAYIGSVRKRYVIPSSEYIGRLNLDANQRIRRSMYEYEQIVAVLPGIVYAELGQDVQIRDKYLRLSNLMVCGHEYSVDANGAVTRLTLASSIYYD